MSLRGMLTMLTVPLKAKMGEGVRESPVYVIVLLSTTQFWVSPTLRFIMREKSVTSVFANESTLSEPYTKILDPSLIDICFDSNLHKSSSTFQLSCNRKL